MTRGPAYELVLALLAIVAITACYVAGSPAGTPSPGGLVGHGLGIVGFLLMLSTETLYTLRKSGRGLHFGQMSTWLHVHIFTGIVGSFLVLLHSGGKFNGLAGVLSLLTVVIVISGFIGRYIYTAVPRTLAGVELSAQELEERIGGAERRLQALGVDLEATPALAAAAEPPRQGWMLVLGRSLLRWRQRRRVRRALRDLNLAGPRHAVELQELLMERYRLLLQVQSLAGTRQLLALWHVGHVPLGGVLFALAFIHIGAALYYATLLK